MSIRKQTAILILLTMCCVGHAQTKEQLTSWLEQYCTEHYGDCYDGKEYVPQSLVINKVTQADGDSIIKVSGVHSYKLQYPIFICRRKCENINFRADILPMDNNKVKIKFWKWYEPDLVYPKGKWEGPCEKTIIP